MLSAVWKLYAISSLRVRYEEQSSVTSCQNSNRRLHPVKTAIVRSILSKQQSSVTSCQSSNRRLQVHHVKTAIVGYILSKSNRFCKALNTCWEPGYPFVQQLVRLYFTRLHTNPGNGLRHKPWKRWRKQVVCLCAREPVWWVLLTSVRTEVARSATVRHHEGGAVTWAGTVAGWVVGTGRHWVCNSVHDLCYACSFKHTCTPTCTYMRTLRAVKVFICEFLITQLNN